MRDWKYHCAILGVRENATAKEVRRAFRRLARERHPDKHNNSVRAKEDFQKLNESYRFLMAAFIAGQPPNPISAPPHASHPSNNTPDPDGKTKTTNFPSASSFPKRAVKNQHFLRPRGYRSVWLHALIACFVISIVSIWLERPGDREPASQQDKRDLSLKAWCTITAQNGTKDFSAFESRANCEETCANLTKNKTAECIWNGTNLRSEKRDTEKDLRLGGNAIPLNPPLAVNERGSRNNDDPMDYCDITIERSTDQPATVRYKIHSEEGCRFLCREKIRETPWGGGRCSWQGKLIISEAPAPRPQATATDILTRESNNDPELNESIGIALGTGPCNMSVLVPDEPPVIQTIPNDTEVACGQRCMDAINSHPIDGEVKCAFNGRQLLVKIPDPMTVYLAKNPELARQGIQQGGQIMANCEVYKTSGVKRLGSSVTFSTQIECESRCFFEFSQAPHGNEITCKFSEKKIFRRAK